MSTIQLPDTVADALEAVAAVDDTDPGQLAGLIVADWLASHRDRFTRAAAALDRLAGEPASNPAATDEFPSAVTGDTPGNPDENSCADCEFVGASQAALNGHRRIHTAARESTRLGKDPASLEIRCEDCGETFAKPQGLGAHRRYAKCAPGAPDLRQVSTPPPPSEPRRIPSTDGCVSCGAEDAPKIIDGERVCRTCWADAA